MPPQPIPPSLSPSIFKKRGAANPHVYCPPPEGPLCEGVWLQLLEKKFLLQCPNRISVLLYCGVLAVKTFAEWQRVFRGFPFQVAV